MIHVIATVTARPGRRADWLAVFKANQPAVLREDGCRGYEVHLPADPGLPGGAPPSADEAVILEAWDSPAHLRAHLEQPHMLAYKEAVKDLVAGPTRLQVLGEAR